MKYYTKTAVLTFNDGDIATVEALHDLLLDNGVCSLDCETLKRARELTAKMYSVLYPDDMLP